MKICELVNNKEFCFNPPFRVIHYIPEENEEGECVLMYDSESKDDMAIDLYLEDITAINQADDGTVEIEYI